jgi:Domain of unknown function (DUF4145)
MAQNWCGHCGLTGTLSPVEPWITLDIEMTEEPNPPFAPEEVSTERRLQIWKCSACGEPTLRQYYWNDVYSDPTDAFDPATLYPRQPETGDMPERVADRYSQLLQQLGQPEMFAVGAGKVLEAVCGDLGITDGKLHHRLERLAASGKLPESLADQALLVKDYRNIGGHDDDREVTAADVTLTRGFVEGLLDYLYWGPARYERAAAAFEERKTKRDGPEMSAG